MEAVKFVEERRRMFAVSAGKYSLFDMNTRAEDVVKEVEEWSAAHPRKTRQGAFLAHYPDAALDDGVLRVCPRNVYKSAELNCNNTTCYLCKRAFWMQEVE
nr:MAG TPA: hypothetical protein [Caudoviricetes sp.]